MKIYLIKYIFVVIVLLAIITLYIGYFTKPNKYDLGNTKILLVFNGEHDKEAENLLASMQKYTPNLVPLIVICVSDNKGKKFSERHGIEYFTMQTINESGEFMSREMNIMTRRKFEGILHLLGQKTDVLYIDTDIVLLSDPFKYIDFKYDLNVQSDECKAPYKHSYLCTGFMYIKSNFKTKRFFAEAIVEMEQSNYKLADQCALNLLIAKDNLLKNANVTEHMSVKVLDVCKFPNGCRYFDGTDKNCRKKDAVIVHNNYLIGIENKMQRFKKYGLLFSADTNIATNSL
jgi:hypothetical protein